MDTGRLVGLYVVVISAALTSTLFIENIDTVPILSITTPSKSLFYSFTDLLKLMATLQLE